LRWAAGIAFAAAGAVALFANGRGRARLAPASAPTADTVESGRGRPQGAPSADARAHGYETVDTDVRALALIMIVAILIMASGTALVFSVYAAFSRQDQAVGRTLTPEQARVIPPPEPRLQADPVKELAALLEAQRERLSTYGWSDGAPRTPHIPITRAMELVVGKPLDPAPLPAPLPAPAATPPSPGATSSPGATPNSGATP
jgi:hypothetical protein